VVAVLQPMLGSGITLRAEGKGETEPVASNDSKAGKALNRRVSLSFSTGGN
jgi:flagellar motor protein MotB